MGTVATDTSKLFGLGAGDISCFASEFSMSGEYAIDDASGMCDMENINVMGKQAVASVSANGRYEDGVGEIAAAANASLASLTNSPSVLLPIGAGHGLPAVCEHGVTTKVEVESPADGLTTIAVEGASDVGLELGLQVGTYKTAITATGPTAVLDGGAPSANGGAYYLAVAALTGITSVTAIIEDSADGSTGWATIAAPAAITTANKTVRVAIAGAIKQYTRVTYTVAGTGSAKVMSAITRNNI